MEMTERIKTALAACGVANWRINETAEETAEWFFVRKKLDTRRAKDTKKYFVTVFCDGEKDGAPARGSTGTELVSSMEQSELERAILEAKTAAGYALNPMYSLPNPVRAEEVKTTGELAEKPLAEILGKMARALFAPDTREDSFVNSAELFVSRKTKRILSSEGTDVSFTEASVDGEFVVQCREPEDVELFTVFSYDECDADALEKKVSEMLDFARDRALAGKNPKSGKFDLILTGDEVGSVLSFYTERSNAAMIYAGYSGWKPGESVLGGEVSGEKPDLTLRAVRPFSGEGVPMSDLPLLRDGKLLTVHGDNRCCRYLGVEPTGEYEKLRCENAGSSSFASLRKAPCLWVVRFSDFQMDVFSGRFGGEIRLAYLIDENGMTPVTGGSVSGSLLELQSDLRFSTERYSSAAYEGPYAVRIAGVSLSGGAE